MKKFLSGAAVAAASLTFATAALAVGPPYCGTYATPSITAPSSGIGIICQDAITKNTQKYLKTVLKVRGKCLSLGNYAACPNTDDDTKVQTAAGKAADKIAAACGDTTGLGSSYANAAAANVASCTLSQTHGTSEIFIGETHGNGGNPVLGNGGGDNIARQACQAGIDKEAQKFLPSLLKIVDKCISTRIKKGNTAGLGAACLGSLSPGGLSAPGDVKVAEAIAKATEKMKKGLDKSCTGLAPTQIGFLYGCPGATSEADLDACVECSGLNSLFEIVGQQYAETGSIVVPGAGNVQTAVNAGGPGDKFLLASGVYSEGVTLPSPNCSVSLGACQVDADCPGGVTDLCESEGDNMQFVGCGAATDDRPRIIPPIMAPPPRGFTAAFVDGLHFQALEVTGWAQDGIFVANAQGVSFRDILGDGLDPLNPADEDKSVYAVFPVRSTDVVVEGCEVINVRDAGIYVGESVGITVRHNLVTDNVTGIEIENSENADVYGNVAHSNTGGILSFKLTSPAKQTSGGHHFFDNVSYSNNLVNFGDPNSTVGNVPQGTGFMIISEDNSIFENNMVEMNRSYGMLILDQEAVNILAGPLFVPKSPDWQSENLKFLNNRMPTGPTRNGTPVIPGTLFAGNYTLALNTPENGTCFSTPVPTTGTFGNAALVAQIVACP